MAPTKYIDHSPTRFARAQDDSKICAANFSYKTLGDPRLILQSAFRT